MKILHAAETIRGGVATVMRLNMVAQTEKFNADNVLALVPADQAVDLAGVAAKQVKTFERTGRNKVSFLRFFKTLRAVVKVEKPDILHLHSTFAGVLGRVAVMGLLGGPKVVYCPHSWAFTMDVHPLKKWVFKGIELLLSGKTEAVLCVSRYEEVAGRHAGIAARKLRVIYNGVHLPTLPVRTGAEEERPVRLLFVGRFDYQKGFDVLLDVMKKLEGKPFELTVVGAAVHSGMQPEERPNITYAGWQAPENMPQFFEQADVLVMPSRWEGFAMVPLEAMSYGLPVLASDYPSIAEAVADQEVGKLFPIGDSAAMAQILAETPLAAWQAFGQAARQRVEDMFTVAHMCDQTMAVYVQVLGHAE